MTQPDLLDLEESAKYFGCTPRLLLRLKRWGWLKSWEDQIRKRCKLQDTHYERSALEVLAVDYMLSMSMYDILFVKANTRNTVKEIAANRGLPLLVARLIQESDLAAHMTKFVRARRNHIDAGEKDITSLAKHMRRLIDPSPGARRDRVTAVEFRFWKNAGLPIEKCETSYENLYKKGGKDWLGGAARGGHRKRSELKN